MSLKYLQRISINPNAFIRIKILKTIYTYTYYPLNVSGEHTLAPKTPNHEPFKNKLEMLDELIFN